MHIDPKSSVPIYRQIVSGVQTAIESGVYKPGECLPSLRAMALDIGVNPNTVQRAYDALEREGTLESRRGVGVFVTDDAALSATLAHLASKKRSPPAPQAGEHTTALSEY